MILYDPTGTREADVIEAGERDYVRVAEAAKRLRVSQPTIWRWIKAGRLPAYRVGPKTIRIKVADLANVVQLVGPRREVSPVPSATAGHAAIEISPMTEEERRRGVAALKEIDDLQERMAAERGGQPFPSSVKLIHKMREERSHDLDNR